MKRPEIAVFGGSFNPPHIAHQQALAWALSQPPVARALVVPTFQHAFHKPMESFAHRFAMAELAFGWMDRVSVSRIEQELGGDSFMVRTLEALSDAMPDMQLRLLIGEDVLADAPRWREFERVKTLAPLLVLGREGHRAGAEVAFTLPDVSSTEVRRRLQLGESVADLVPASVIAYIDHHHLYRMRVLAS